MSFVPIKVLVTSSSILLLFCCCSLLGKIKYVGLSECTPSELRRAHAVHPVTAIQMEWSLQSRDIEPEVVPTARELGVGKELCYFNATAIILLLCQCICIDIFVPVSVLPTGIVAYSPLCRGFLTALDRMEQLDANDSRRSNPRFTGDNYVENKRRVQKFFDIVAAKGCTASQLALAWVHGQGVDVFPIPGTKSSARIRENAGAFAVLQTLTAEDMKSITECVEVLEGERYPPVSNFQTFNQRL
jgi:aryl-alcohol dehydrogenase-like predicted oxidoreductase